MGLKWLNGVFLALSVAGCREKPAEVIPLPAQEPARKITFRGNGHVRSEVQSHERMSHRKLEAMKHQEILLTRCEMGDRSAIDQLRRELKQCTIEQRAPNQYISESGNAVQIAIIVENVGSEPTWVRPEDWRAERSSSSRVGGGAIRTPDYIISWGPGPDVVEGVCWLSFVTVLRRMRRLLPGDQMELYSEVVKGIEFQVTAVDLIWDRTMEWQSTNDDLVFNIPAWRPEINLFASVEGLRGSLAFRVQHSATATAQGWEVVASPLERAIGDGLQNETSDIRARICAANPQGELVYSEWSDKTQLLRNQGVLAPFAVELPGRDPSLTYWLFLRAGVSDTVIIRLPRL